MLIVQQRVYGASYGQTATWVDVGEYGTVVAADKAATAIKNGIPTRQVRIIVVIEYMPYPLGAGMGN